MKKSHNEVVIYGYFPNFVLIANDKNIIFEVITSYKPQKVAIIKSRWWSIVVDNKQADYYETINSQLRYLQLLGFAYIYHDKDLTDNKHYHILINTKQSTTLQKISKVFGVRPNKVERVTLPNKMKRYLLHKDNPNKYQYDTSEVITSFRDFQTIVSNDISELGSDGSSDYAKVFDLIDTYSQSITTFRDLVCVVRATMPEMLGFVSKNTYTFTTYIKHNENITQKGSQKIKSQYQFTKDI